MSILEVLAAVCGLLAVALTIMRSVWCWPIGLMQVLLYTKVFYDARLYSQTGLQIVFALLQVHGWLQWKKSLAAAQHGAAHNLGESQHHDGQHHAHGLSERIEVQQLSWPHRTMALVAAVAISLVLGWFMQRFTHATWPLADATLTGFSLVAQWLLIHRQLENWWLWIAVNILSIIVFSAQGLWPTVGLYVAFLGMATQGWITWRRELRVR